VVVELLRNSARRAGDIAQPIYQNQFVRQYNQGNPFIISSYRFPSVGQKWQRLCLSPMYTGPKQRGFLRVENAGTTTRFATGIGLLLLLITPLASPQMKVGDNLQMKANGLLTAGYQGVYGDSSQIQSSHGLDFGIDGTLSGSYYNPNFLSFNLTPYYNRSQANSTFQSLTGASGITGTANLFTGSHFPGSVSYRNDYNSTGTFGLAGEPNFTTHGHGEGFGIGWSALLPGLPTLSANYTQGSGSGTVFGTSQETGSDTKVFNLRST
jgi:hypothetical protein